MEKIFAIIGVSLCAALASCEPSSEYNDSDNGKRMEKVEDNYSHEIWRDRKTGCEYFVRYSSRGIAIVQLTDSEGKPKTSE